ncbi:MAG TPA: LysR family transcriptional regulator [Candidatus Blautia faecavium]|uniref:LysR family transcriptional regulator n=1 Tax=Candidatus Blautia faecavium TaxID=2838487 RepID=A0A9D2LTU0_9FIRM|nr:LysR family transcriptional regulator [Candidatus Blautia faecavium]
MTIRHLKIFLQVADTGKMSAAAKNLFMTQPSVSQAVRELEEHYHTLLFERLSNKLFITESGKQLYTYAKMAVEQFDFLEEKMAYKNRRERFRIGATVSVGGSILSHIVNELNKAFPEMDVYCFVGNTQEIENKLLNAELDAGIVEGFIKNPELLTTPLIKDPLVLACSKEHPLAKEPVIHTKDLEGKKFVIREAGSGTRELLERFLSSQNINVHVAFEAHTPDSIKNAVRYNNCLSLISSRLLTDELSSGDFVAFSHEKSQWDRYFRLVRHKNKKTGSTFTVLEEILKSCEEKDSPSSLIRGRLLV